MKPLLSVLAVALFVAWACLACASSSDDAAQRLRSAADDECGRAVDYPDQPGRRSATRYQLLVALECRLATMSPGFGAAFDRGSIRTFRSNDQLRAILQTLETIPDRGDDVGRALTILLRAAHDAGIPEVVGPAFRPALHDLIDDVLATHPDAFVNAFDSELLQALSVDELTSIYTTIIELPREAEHLLANIEVVHELALSTQIKGDLMSAGYARVLRDAVVSLANGFDSSFAGALNMGALNDLSLNQLQVLHSTFLALPNNAQPTSANLGRIYEDLRSADAPADLVIGAYASSLIDDVATAVAAAHPNLLRVFRHGGLQHLSITRLRVVLETIGSLMDGGRDARGALASMHAALVRSGLSTGASYIGYHDLLVHQIDAVVSGMHENFRRVFRHDGLQYLNVGHLHAVLETIDLLVDGGHDAQSALASTHAALVSRGLSTGASRIGYHDLLVHQIDTVVSGMHENFRRVVDGRALHRNPIEHLEFILEALQDLPSGYGEDGEAALTTVQMAGRSAGLNLDIGYSRLIAEQRMSILATIEQTLESMAPAFVDAFSTSRMTSMSPEVLQTVLRELENLPNRGTDVASSLSQILAAAVAAGHDPAAGDFGINAFRTTMHTALNTAIAALNESVRLHLKTDVVSAANVDLLHLQAVLAAVLSVRDSRDPVEALTAIHTAAVKAGVEAANANFGLADAVASKLQERFSGDLVLSGADTADYVADQTDAVALAIFRTASRFYIPSADPIGLIEALHVSAVQAGMSPDATNFGQEEAVNLLTPVQVTKTWVTTSSTGEAVFRWNMVNYYDVGIKAIRFAIYAYDSFGEAFGGGCLPFPARGELRLTRVQQYGRAGRGVGGLSWWWEGWRCTARADRFDLRILDVVFLDDTRWTP